MSWKPCIDFEEEIVNLQQPNDDYLFGGFLNSDSEPQPSYPRPQSHIDYASSKLMQAKKLKEEEIPGNKVLHVISEVEKIAGTKPWGELPSVNDWNTHKNVEAETIAMIRHFGMGPSLESPLDQNLTIATYPTENDIQVIKDGSRTFPVLLNKNLFKLKPKDSTSSSSYVDPSDIILPSYDDNSTTTKSFTTTSSSKEYDDAVGELSFEKYDKKDLLSQAELHLQQYPKLKAEKSKKAKKGNKNELGKNKSLETSEPHFLLNTSSGNNSSSSKPKSSFLQRFLVTDDDSAAKSKASKTSAPILPVTYASVTKTLVKPPPAAAKATTSQSLNVLQFPKLWRSSQTPKPSVVQSPRAWHAIKSSNGKQQ